MKADIQQFLIGDYRNFIYLITSGGKSVVIDPQKDLSPWLKCMNGSELVGVLLTHTHWDHVAGVPDIMTQYKDIPIYMHALDSHRLQSVPGSRGANFVLLEDGATIELGEKKIELLHAPGHSAGEVCYLLEDEGTHHLFTGDTVFVGDVGRTDLETGNNAEMFETLQRLKKLPPTTVIYPGHDYGRTPTSTIEYESKNSAAWLCKSVEELSVLP